MFIKTANSVIKQDRTPIFRLYCSAGSKVEVEVPKMQKPSYSSSNCPAFAASYVLAKSHMRAERGTAWLRAVVQPGLNRALPG